MSKEFLILFILHGMRRKTIAPQTTERWHGRSGHWSHLLNISVSSPGLYAFPSYTTHLRKFRKAPCVGKGCHLLYLYILREKNMPVQITEKSDDSASSQSVLKFQQLVSLLEMLMRSRKVLGSDVFAATSLHENLATLCFSVACLIYGF